MDKGISREELLKQFEGHPNVRFLTEKPELRVQIHTKWNGLVTSFNDIKRKPFSDGCPYCEEPYISCLRHYSITPSPAEVQTSELPKVAKELHTEATKEQDHGS